MAGLRISEARNLQTEDVDLQEGVLTIRGTKFGKSRLVPIHPSTCIVLSDYALRRDRWLARRPAAFFVSSRGTRLDGAEIRRTFYTLSRQIGLRGPSDSHGPRLHDFRHRFAVETLVQWYRSGQDVERRLPILSTYLGHSHVAYTYWYLTACPELMGLAVKNFFTQRLMSQRQASPHTVGSYRDTFRLLSCISPSSVSTSRLPK